MIRDVLAALEERGPLPLSRLATHANLPYDRLKALVGELEERGLVRVRRGASLTAEITEKGEELLEEIRRLERLLRDLGLA